MSATEASQSQELPGDDLAMRIAALDLDQNVREFDDNGYTVIQDPVAHALTDRVREAILRLAQDSDPPLKGWSAGLLLGRDPVFAEAVLVQKLLTLVDYLLGRGLFFESTTEKNGATNPALLQNTYRLVHGPRGY